MAHYLFVSIVRKLYQRMFGEGVPCFTKEIAIIPVGLLTHTAQIKAATPITKLLYANRVPCDDIDVPTERTIDVL